MNCPSPELPATRTRELFVRHRLRCTRQRLAVYETLYQCRCHPTAEELFRMSQALIGSLSRATVYNTLDALCEAGLVRRLPTAAGCCRFDADMTDHLHLRLRDSSELRDVPADLGSRLIRNLPADVLAEIERRMGMSIDGVNIQLIASKA